jgi:hypothetical protein
MIIINYFSPEVQGIITSSSIQPQVRAITEEQHITVQNAISQTLQSYNVDLATEITLLCSRLSMLFSAVSEYNKTVEATKPGKLDPKKVN